MHLEQIIEERVSGLEGDVKKWSSPIRRVKTKPQAWRTERGLGHRKECNIKG